MISIGTPSLEASDVTLEVESVRGRDVRGGSRATPARPRSKAGWPRGRCLSWMELAGGS